MNNMKRWFVPAWFTSPLFISGRKTNWKHPNVGRKFWFRATYDSFRSEWWQSITKYYSFVKGRACGQTSNTVVLLHLLYYLKKKNEKGQCSLMMLQATNAWCLPGCNDSPCWATMVKVCEKQTFIVCQHIMFWALNIKSEQLLSFKITPVPSSITNFDRKKNINPCIPA